MIICVDITCLAVDNWTGVQNSYFELVQEFITQNKSDKIILFALAPKALSSKLNNLDFGKFEHLKIIIKPVPQRLFIPTLSFIQQHQFPFMNLFFGDVDVYVSGGYFWLPTKSKLSICVIHDVSDDMQIIEKDRLNHAAKFADLFIAPSKSTKNKSVKKLGISSSNIKIIPWALDLNKYKKKIPKKVEGLRSNNFFMAFDGAKRKNFARTKKAFIESNLKTKLFVLGNGDYVTDAEYLWLLQNMKGLIYPSTDEGFGLPILEALYFNKPVLTSDLASMPEVGGDAVIYCDPFDVKSIAKGIKKIDSQKFDKSKAKKQLNKFSYSESAKKLKQIINKNL